MLGLNAYTAGLALRTALHGGEAGVYRGEGIRAEEVPLVVRLRREDRDEMADVGRFALPSVTGASVRLSNVGSLVEAEAPVEIRRKNRERIMTVSANAEGRPLSDIAADIDARLAELELPEGVAVEFGGDVEQQREVMGEVRIALLFSILLVYMVMAGQYGTLRDPLVVMFSVPFAFTGVFLGVRAVGMTFSLINFLGLIMLMGIVVNNAIVLVDYVNLLRREQAMPVLRAVVETGRRRLRPVLITAMTTMFGMLPMALAKGEGHAIWQPIGVSMIGGLLVSTVVTLFLVPVVYTIFHWPAVRRERRAAATAAAAAPDAGVPTPDPPAEGP
jgi:HAE1 family hydrophobic/amphiphilic exporter-1